MTKNLVYVNVSQIKEARSYQDILQIVKELSDLMVYDLVKYFDQLTETEYVFQELATIEVAVERSLIEVSPNGEITYLVAKKTLEREDAK